MTPPAHSNQWFFGCSKYTAAALATLLLACSAPAKVPNVTTTADSSALPIPPLIQRCEGTNLDLRWAVKNCVRPQDETVIPIPETISAHLQPSTLHLKPGATAQIDLVLENSSEIAATFDFPALECAIEPLDVLIFDAQNEPLTQTCIGGGGCDSEDIRVTIAPRGNARIRFQVQTEQRIKEFGEGGRCELAKGMLPPGTYHFRVSEAAWFDRPYAIKEAEGVLRIEAAEVDR